MGSGRGSGRKYMSTLKLKSIKRKEKGSPTEYGYQLTSTGTSGKWSAFDRNSDLIGTVLGTYISTVYQDRLAPLKGKQTHTWDDATGDFSWEYPKVYINDKGIKGLCLINGKLSIDGNMGVPTVTHISHIVGIEIVPIRRNSKIVGFEVVECNAST